MLLPALSQLDPRLKAEGSLDPLGFVPVSDRLADAIWPDLTIRMRRVRALTTIAVMSVVCEPFRDQMAADGVSPAHQVFEWYFVEAHARAAKEPGADTMSLPGIDKARHAVAEGQGLSADRYLKVPGVFGLHGVYKRLARGLGVVDDNLLLGSKGLELLAVWEADQGLGGFADPTETHGEGVSLRDKLQWAVADGLKAARTDRSATWRVWPALVQRLGFASIGPLERECLGRLLTECQHPLQAEFFQRLWNPAIRRAWEETPQISAPGRRKERDEHMFYEKLRHEVSPDLRDALDAITAYERVARIIDDVWRQVLYLATKSSPAPLSREELADSLPGGRHVQDLRRAMEAARAQLAQGPAADAFEQMVLPFEGLQDEAQLFDAVIERHRSVQLAKPPDGKRPWLESDARGRVLVRADYRREIPPEWDDTFVDPYRTVAVCSLLDDLHGAEGEG